jgi:hypothetical protein
MSWEGAVFVGSGGGVRAGQRLSTSTLMQRPERDVTGVSTFSVIRYHAARPDPIIHSVPSHTSGRQLGTWIPGRTHATSGACPSLRARAEFNGGDEQLKYGYSEMNPRRTSTLVSLSFLTVPQSMVEAIPLHIRGHAASLAAGGQNMPLLFS